MFRRLLLTAIAGPPPPTSCRPLATSGAQLAGHSKWSNIRHIKAAKDGQRSLLFVKLARQIRCAIQEGGSAVAANNSQLRQALEEAAKRDMPNHTVQGILRKAAAAGAAQARLKKHVVEARVINKVFMVLVWYSDNYTGDRMQLATLFRKGGAVPMDVRHMFEEKGFVEAQLLPAAPEAVAPSEEALAELGTEDAIEFGAEDAEVLDVEQRRILFICDPEELERLRQKLGATGRYTIDSVEHAFIPNGYVQLSDAELASYRMLRDKLKAFDGVEDIYDNVSPEALRSLDEAADDLQRRRKQGDRK